MKNKTIESFFEDVPEYKNKALKDIFEKEEEYEDVLESIEYAIAEYYQHNPHIKDQDVVKSIDIFRKNYDQEFDENSLEHAIKAAAISGLEKFTKTRKISRHEFILVLDYIPWSVSNGDWIPGKNGYLKWLCSLFALPCDDDDFYDSEPKAVTVQKTGRNDPCPCGSGKKYKKCCMLKEENSDTMENECMQWLKECMTVFPRLNGYTITCGYAKMPPENISITQGRATIKRAVDPEAVLLNLKGDSGATIIETQSKTFSIEINQNIRKIRSPPLRKQVVLHSLVGDLVRIEGRKMITKRKEGEKRKNRRMPKKEFDLIFLQKFNEVRALSGLPPVANMANVDAAIAKILSEIKFE